MFKKKKNLKINLADVYELKESASNGRQQQRDYMPSSLF